MSNASVLRIDREYRSSLDDGVLVIVGTWVIVGSGGTPHVTFVTNGIRATSAGNRSTCLCPIDPRNLVN